MTRFEADEYLARRKLDREQARQDSMEYFAVRFQMIGTVCKSAIYTDWIKALTANDALATFKKNRPMCKCWIAAS